MHIVFQHSHLGGDSEHDYRWALVDAAGNTLGHFHSPEAALLEATEHLETDLDTIALAREGAGVFAVVGRTQQRAGHLPPDGCPARPPPCSRLSQP